MKTTCTVLIILCTAAIIVAGCTTNSSPATTAPASTPAPSGPQSCTKDSDCVPVPGCHPASCANAAAVVPTNAICTAVCSGPLDCGAGSCGCVHNTCSIVPAQSVTSPAPSPAGMSLSIIATPQRYTPPMSSTVGIGLQVSPTGFNRTGATYQWSASYGQFLSWAPPDFTVIQLGTSPKTHGEKIFWSFTSKTQTPDTPVTITVVARDAAGNELASSRLNLVWDGDYTVTVQS